METTAIRRTRGSRILKAYSRKKLIFQTDQKAIGFGNPTLDERSILAPLYQCCIIRVSTWNRLNHLKANSLWSAMKKAMGHDPIFPVLLDSHLEAMERRLLGILATVKQCTDQLGSDVVLVEDRMPLSHL